MVQGEEEQTLRAAGGVVVSWCSNQPDHQLQVHRGPSRTQTRNTSDQNSIDWQFKKKQQVAFVHNVRRIKLSPLFIVITFIVNVSY